nr:hypothetical protein [Tanacetum cinerariifolium]
MCSKFPEANVSRCLPPQGLKLLPSPLAHVTVDRHVFVATESKRRTLLEEGSLSVADSACVFPCVLLRWFEPEALACVEAVDKVMINSKHLVYSEEI